MSDADGLTLCTDDIAELLVSELRGKLLAEFERIAARLEADIRRQVRGVDCATLSVEFAEPVLDDGAPPRRNGQEHAAAALDSWAPY